MTRYDSIGGYNLQCLTLFIPVLNVIMTFYVVVIVISSTSHLCVMLYCYSDIKTRFDVPPSTECQMLEAVILSSDEVAKVNY